MEFIKNPLLFANFIFNIKLFTYLFGTTMRKLLVFISACVFSISLMAQENTRMALMFMDPQNYGSARVQAMGGAFGALGADVTMASSNPAGLGLFRSSKATITGQMNNFENRTFYLDENSSIKQSEVNFNQVGFVKHSEVENSHLKSINFAVGYNKIANLNRSQSVRATTKSKNSLIHHYLYLIEENEKYAPTDLINGNSNVPMLAELAYNSNLLYNVEGNETDYEGYLQASDGIFQEKTLTATGYIGEYYLSVGGNFGDKIYAGLGVGLRSLHYAEEVYLSESDSRRENDVFNDYNYDASSKTVGSGINFKFGLIYKINQAFRVSGAIETQTYYKLRYSVDHSMKTSLVTGQYSHSINYDAPDYKFNTPTIYKLAGSYVHKKSFIVGVEIEYKDYSSANYFADSYNFADENTDLIQALKGAANFKTGIEYRLGILSVRGGAALYGDPYKNKEFSMYNNFSLSAGAGLMLNKFNLDFAFVQTHFVDYGYMVAADDLSSITNNISRRSAILSMSYSF